MYHTQHVSYPILFIPNTFHTQFLFLPTHLVPIRFVPIHFVAICFSPIRLVEIHSISEPVKILYAIWTDLAIYRIMIYWKVSYPTHSLKILQNICEAASQKSAICKKVWANPYTSSSSVHGPRTGECARAPLPASKISWMNSCEGGMRTRPFWVQWGRGSCCPASSRPLPLRWRGKFFRN